MQNHSPTQREAGDRAVHYLIGIVIGGSLTNWLSNHLFTADTIWWVGPTTALLIVCTLIYQGRYLSLEQPSLLQRIIAYAFLAGLITTTALTHLTEQPVWTVLIAPICLTTATALILWPTLHQTISLRDTLLGLGLILHGISIILMRWSQPIIGDPQFLYSSLCAAVAALCAGIGFLRNSRIFFGIALAFAAGHFLCTALIPDMVGVHIDHAVISPNAALFHGILLLAVAATFPWRPKWALIIGCCGLTLNQAHILALTSTFTAEHIISQLLDGPRNALQYSALFNLVIEIGVEAILTGGYVILSFVVIFWESSTKTQRRTLLGAGFLSLGTADFLFAINMFTLTLAAPGMSEIATFVIYFHWSHYLLFGLAFLRQVGTRVFGFGFIVFGAGYVYEGYSEVFKDSNGAGIGILLVGIAFAFGGFARVLQWEHLQTWFEEGWDKLLKPEPRPGSSVANPADSSKCKRHNKRAIIAEKPSSEEHLKTPHYRGGEVRLSQIIPQENVEATNSSEAT